MAGCCSPRWGSPWTPPPGPSSWPRPWRTPSIVHQGQGPVDVVDTWQYVDSVVGGLEFPVQMCHLLDPQRECGSMFRWWNLTQIMKSRFKIALNQLNVFKHDKTSFQSTKSISQNEDFLIVSPSLCESSGSVKKQPKSVSRYPYSVFWSWV